MNFEIREVQLEPQPALVIKFSTPPENLGEKLGVHLPATFQYAVSKGIEIIGMPFVRYLEMTDVFTVEAGVRVATPDPGEGEIYGTEIAGGAAITTDYYGPYQGLGTAHEALSEWAAANGHAPEWGGLGDLRNGPEHRTGFEQVADPGVSVSLITLANVL